MVQAGVERILPKNSQVSINKSLDYDIVIFAHARWDGQYSSTSYSLAKALSLHTRVFYIDNPFSWKVFFTEHKSEQIQKRKKALLFGKDIFFKPDRSYPQLTAVSPKLIFPVNWMSEGFLYDTFSKMNDRIVSNAINETLEKFKVKKYAYVNCFNPHYGQYFKLDQKPFLTTYYNVDDISQGPYLHKHGVRLEADLMRKSDFTLVTSSELKKLSARHSNSVHLLPNAADVNLFQKALHDDTPMPDEIRQLPRDKKIICYTGNICYRLDYDLLIKIAKEHHDKVLLMIGPFTIDAYKSSGLSALPNVVFTGRKSIQELPSYLKYSDCCIIPFLCNQLTKSIYPLKINEYLSAGKAVITTDFSDDIRSFNSVAYVSSSHTEFVNNIDRAIAEDNSQLKHTRSAYAAKNAWSDRAQQFIGIVEEFLHGKR
jgi:teichuronic acid biosynthesis glycosyltransferase TuaH